MKCVKIKCVKTNMKKMDCVLYHDTKGKLPMIDCIRCIKAKKQLGS